MDDLLKIANNFTQYHASLPRKVGAWAVEFFKDSFRRQGFIDKRYEHWKPRKGKDKRQGRAILVDTGKMMRAIRVAYAGKDYVVIGNDDPKAKVHNEGFQGTVRQNVKAHKRRQLELNDVSKPGARKPNVIQQSTGVVNVRSFTRTVKMNIPKRQFMGSSEFLEKRIEMRIRVDLERIFGIR